MIDTIHLVNPVQSCKSCLTRRLTLRALTRIVSRFGPKVWKQTKATSSWFCRCGGVARPWSIKGRL